VRNQTSAAAGVTAESRSMLRAMVWGLHMALPLLGLWLLVAQPQLDVHWEHHLSHFWLVLLAAGISLALAVAVGQDARRREDARLVLVSMAFLTAAGFLALHGIATPRVLLPGPNAGFALSTPIGLALAGAFALASSLELGGTTARRIAASERWLRLAVVAALLVWGVVSLLRLPPLDAPLPPDAYRRAVLPWAVAGTGLYVLAGARYLLLYRRRRSAMLLSIVTGFVLLAEALVATVYGRNWQLSWWSWHVLMVVAFAFVAYSARVQRVREGSRAGLFAGIALQETVRRLHEEYRVALEELVAAMESRAEAGEAPIDAAAVGPAVAARFDLTERQVDVLERSAEALANERQQQRRLAALVAVGQEARVIRKEEDLLERALAHATHGFGRDELQVHLLEDGTLSGVKDAAVAESAIEAIGKLEAVESEDADNGPGMRLVIPLAVKGSAAGVLSVHRPAGRFADRDRGVLESLANQLSTALENARLYRQLDGLFRSYMSPAVATKLISDPGQAKLGGAIQEVTVLMADLRGFTPFSERSAPDEVVRMLNTYFGAAVPVILEAGGTVVQFVGDAVMAIFNAPTRQPEHALLAARAALAMQGAIGRVAAGRPGWPRFRVGINTGPALVGNIGSDQLRNFTAIGDTTNLAARLEGLAGEGQVVLGAATRAALGDAAMVDPLGTVTVKGKEQPVEVFRLVALRPAG
jgi:class 3 adenylate cyclase